MTEMGLVRPAEAVASQDITVQQMVALLNRAGNDLVIGYPWQHLTKEYTFNTSTATLAADGKTLIAPLPSDWSYFLDQTQWDRTNHWPLAGPKTAQEWQWLKSGILSSGPRIRYRVVGNNLELFPDGNTDSNIAMEYVSNGWVQDADSSNQFYDYPHADNDKVAMDFWVLTAYLKLKYWEAKGLDTSAYSKDFVNVWNARIGKDKGAPILSLAPVPGSQYVGVHSVPDGNWNVATP